MNKNNSLILALLLPLAVACAGQESLLHRKPAAEGPVPVRVVTVRSVSVEGGAGFVGTVKSTRSAVLRAPAAGTLTQINVREGSPVRKGQVLAVMESETLTSAHRAAKATLEQAEDGFQRVEMVYGRGAVTEAEYRKVLAQLEQARAAESAARDALEKCTMKAPFDAVVEKIGPSAGMELLPAEAVVHLTDLDALHVSFALPETEFSAYQVGDKARVSVPALELEADGVLEAKGISASLLSRSYDCSISLSGRQTGLMPGMVCKVTLGKDIGRKALVLPSSAVMTDRNGRYVWAVDASDIVERKYIQVDGYAHNGVCVTEGLAEGDRVITEGRRNVSVGAKVKVVTE